MSEYLFDCVLGVFVWDGNGMFGCMVVIYWEGGVVGGWNGWCEESVVSRRESGFYDEGFIVKVDEEWEFCFFFVLFVGFEGLVREVDLEGEVFFWWVDGVFGNDVVLRG